MTGLGRGQAMSENGYLISDAAKQVEVESHVLRYWEEELKMEIPRNEMGHRYYTEEHIQRFKKIKELKDKGYQLKAIKSVISGEVTEEAPDITTLPETQVSSSVSVDHKMEQFHVIMTDIVSQALARNSEVLGQEIAGRVEEKVIKEMNYIMRVQEEKQEERFKKMDELLRTTQRNNKVRKEAAATIAPVVKMKKKRQGFLKFKKKK